MSNGTLLLTGGAGYIGSHACVVLTEAGYRVIVVDDLVNSSATSLDRVRELVPSASLAFHELDLRDTAGLDKIVAAEPIDGVIHFAGLKAVGESVEQPLRYYQVNLGATMSLLDVLTRHNIRRVVFSSSATVYGIPDAVPIDESAPLRCTNPYGRTKLMIEEMLVDLAASDPAWRIALLRYFNPVGAHPSGCIGEDPNGIPNNLMPYVMQVAVGRRAHLTVFGNDYETPDGTGVRDYIHVMDLVEGHLAAIRALDHLTGSHAVNLGTGTGYSVLDMVRAAERASGAEVPYVVGPRRAGDAASSYCDPARAHDLLAWEATRGLDEMCADAWRWQSSNPAGYATP